MENEVSKSPSVGGSSCASVTWGHLDLFNFFKFLFIKIRMFKFLKPVSSIKQYNDLIT